ncbi:MAG: endonuclease MutS2, partial [Acutalibacteraceae bacterium]
SESIVTQRDGRFVVPVKAECRGNVPGLVHDTSRGGQTVFIEPMGVVQANNDIKVLLSKEEKEIEKIIMRLSSLVGESAENIKISYENLTYLDVIFSKARLAYKMKATTPLMNDQKIIDLKKARHPLIDKEKVVPVDIRLGEDFDTLIITGPNTGGKTVSIKTVGLLTLMAMSGMMIPAGDNSRVSVFKRILSDIGDEQSIEQSLSTFSAHMTNIIDIIEHANRNSLVLIDELGAGTDPVEGAALAVAILEKLRYKKASVACTTHYAELKEFALNTEGVENGSCEFDIATLRPTYRLLIGIPGKSNAFAISSKLGLSEEIINRANHLVSSENKKFEDTIASIEEARQEMEGKLKEATKQSVFAENLKKEAEKEIAKMKRVAEREITLAKQEASMIASRTKAQAEEIIEELQKLQKQKELSVDKKAELKKAINTLEKESDPVVNVKKEEYTPPRPYQKGDSVLIFDIDKKATILSIGEKEATVQAGIIKTKVPLSNLRLLKEKPKTAVKPQRRQTTLGRDMNAGTEVDVRGESAEEAIMDVDRAIDTAV